MPTTGGYSDPLTFAAISVLIGVLLRALVSFSLLKLGIRSRMLTFGSVQNLGFDFISSNVILPFISGIVSLFIIALITNFIYRALGGTGNYEGTMRFISYAYAPGVLTWIPILGLITGIYQLYLLIVGGMIVHNVSMKNSIIATFLPAILFFLLILVLIVAIALSSFANFLHGYSSLR